jgi:hypothetical protein
MFVTIAGIVTPSLGFTSFIWAPAGTFTIAGIPGTTTTRDCAFDGATPGLETSTVKIYLHVQIPIST